MLEDLMNETVALVKEGKIVKNDILASVQENKIYTFDTSTSFYKDDIIRRELSNGNIEEYKINDPELIKGLGKIKDYFKLHVTKQQVSRS